MAAMHSSLGDAALSLSACLQVLWAEERAQRGLSARQSFVDLGCGNGLLVHILTNEGVSSERFWMNDALIRKGDF